MGWESFVVFRSDIGPLLLGQMMIATLSWGSHKEIPRMGLYIFYYYYTTIIHITSKILLVTR